ncbi:MAG: hypothetical protein HYX77_01595 [Acidobacteria bacterium]|nr:hypothetical protein [Acidobacteriota bacterium]
MTRLVGEIHTAHGERQRLVVEMKRAVAQMRGGFRTAHAEMARRQRRNLREFMSGLQSRVGALRHAFRTDIAGAHAAWFGTVAAAGPTGREHSKRAVKAIGG